MTKNITLDGIIQDWDARTRKESIKGRKPRNIKGGSVNFPASRISSGRCSPRVRLEMTVGRVPEVMVKITVGRKDPVTGKHRLIMTDMRSIKAHFDYISRTDARSEQAGKEQVDLEDENSAILSGKEDIRDLCDEWAMGYGSIPKKGGRRREAFNIILSMPPGTSRQAVTDAARQFALEAFGNHQFVMATHTDEPHPHVHLCVKAVDREGLRLNPRKADLQRWREHFADKLRDEGVTANATPRRIRGVTHLEEKQAVRWINQEYREGRRPAPAKVTSLHEVKKPETASVIRSRKEVIQAYGDVARALARSPHETDKRLALQIVDFVKGFPAIKIPAVGDRTYQKETGHEGRVPGKER